MSRTMPQSASSGHRLLLENVNARMAKADLKKVETADFKAAIGRVVTRARAIAGLTQDELAGAIATVLGREKFDAAQIARWEAGKERPQFDVILQIPAMRWPTIQCFAQLDEAVEVVTEIRRRTK